VNESASVGEFFLLEADIVRVLGVGGDNVSQIGLEIPVNRAISIFGWFEADAQVEISWKVRGDGLDVVEQGVLRDGVKVLLDWIPANNKTLLRVSIVLSGCGTLSSCSAISGCAFGIELAVCLLDKIWDIRTHPIHKICQDSLVADAVLEKVTIPSVALISRGRSTSGRSASAGRMREESVNDSGVQGLNLSFSRISWEHLSLVANEVENLLVADTDWNEACMLANELSISRGQVC